MNKLRLRRYALLLLSTSMVAVGYMGLVGRIEASSTLIAVLLGTLVVLAFSLGRQSTQLYGG